mgnify:CR=1 FL=1
MESRKIVFDKLPNNLYEFKVLANSLMDNPFGTTALTILAFTYYPKDQELSLAMVDYLRGPRPLSMLDKQFIADRFREKDYVPRSYFEGAVPQNDYEASEPHAIVVSDNPYSYKNEGYATLYVSSGGADNPRQVQLRKAKDNKWYLWEQFILVDIRPCESANPWA